jgi:cytochrome c-type biogenesis protein CcmH
MRRLLALLAALMALAAGPAVAPAGAVTLTDVEDEVMCVTCNVPLSVAESPQAYRQREEIRRLIDDGLSKDEIKDRLVAEYGPNVLALPDADEGIGMAAYAVPIAGGVGLLAVMGFLLPRWHHRAAAPAGSGAAGADAPASGPSPTDDEARRLDEDLARFDA